MKDLPTDAKGTPPRRAKRRRDHRHHAYGKAAEPKKTRDDSDAHGPTAAG